jgi:hypothetical protein
MEQIVKPRYLRCKKTYDIFANAYFLKGKDYLILEEIYDQEGICAYVLECEDVNLPTGMRINGVDITRFFMTPHEMRKDKIKNFLS